MTPRAPDRRPASRAPAGPRRSRGHWLLTALLAVWAIGALPLLALPVDWAVVCGCDACPVSGGPSCCCASFPSWANADGTPGKRAAFTQPSVGQKSQGCVGPASQTAHDWRALRIAVDSGDDLEPPSAPSDLPPSVTAAVGLHDFPVVLPRPPPAWTQDA
ncbi:MAG: hypothetical protein AAGM22_12195 [Acidobacteriota bacterium]